MNTRPRTPPPTPSPRPIVWESWTLLAEADRDFHRILFFVCLIGLALTLFFGLLKLPPLAVLEKPEPERYVDLLPPPVVAPPPKPVPVPITPPPTETPPPKPVRAEKPEPTAEQRTANARAAAQQSGLLALSQQLSALRNEQVDNTNIGHQAAANIISTQSAGSRSAPAFAPNAAQASTGIGNTGSVNGSSHGTALGQHGTSAVRSPVAGGQLARAGTPGPSGWSDEDIQRVFDRNKTAINLIFNRAAREDASIVAGKVLVNFTIQPDGSVSDCHVVSSSYNNPALEEKIIQRIKLMNFGAKPVAARIVRNYPLNYLPD